MRTSCTGRSDPMIALPAVTQIWIAAGVTDLRRGFTGLSATVQTVLEQSPFSGHVFVFRGRRGDLIKLLWWDGDGQVGQVFFSSSIFRKRSWAAFARAGSVSNRPVLSGYSCVVLRSLSNSSLLK